MKEQDSANGIHTFDIPRDDFYALATPAILDDEEE